MMKWSHFVSKGKEIFPFRMKRQRLDPGSGQLPGQSLYTRLKLMAFYQKHDK
jgi:hypothetical protein